MCVRYTGGRVERKEEHLLGDEVRVGAGQRVEVGVELVVGAERIEERGSRALLYRSLPKNPS